MIVFAGGLLLVLGLASGLFLMLAPFGVGSATPGVTALVSCIAGAEPAQS